MFIFGFLLATMLWLGLWFYHQRPAQAAALGAKEAALLNCVAAKDQCSELKARIQAENREINAKLKQAVLAWGRCIRSKNAPEAQEKPKPSAP